MYALLSSISWTVQTQSLLFRFGAGCVLPPLPLLLRRVSSSPAVISCRSDGAPLVPCAKIGPKQTTYQN